MSNKKTVGYLMYLLKTDEGFLHKNIDEFPIYKDKDGNERNYTFTNDPFEAYQFNGQYQGKAPKYLYVTAPIEKRIDTVKDACDFLGGKMMVVSVNVKTSWTEELDKEELSNSEKRRQFENMYKEFDENLPNECSCCGDTKNLTIHHIVPLTLGGTNKITNLSRLCETCHNKIHGRNIMSRELQKIGIKNSKKRGTKFGRPKKEITKEFEEAYTNWKSGNITAVKAMKFVGMKSNTFYRRVAEYEANQAQTEGQT